ncbi:MAG: MFS transporter [Planctomycetaceae bacterium]
MAERETIQPEGVLSAVVVSQMLFMAGHSLTSTTSGFLTYSFFEFAPSAFAAALLLTLPDAAGMFGLATRWLSQYCGGRKRVWMTSFLAARVASFLIPIALVWREQVPLVSAQTFILICVGVWHMCQAVSFLAYLSWISVLVKDNRWGRLFAAYSVASLVVRFVLPTVIALWREHSLQDASPVWKMGSYAVVFALGGLLCLASMIPLLRLPDAIPEETHKPSGSSPSTVNRMWSVLKDSKYRRLLAHWWWLSLFQGLTQAILWKYRINVLNISLPTFLMMDAGMFLLQIPMSIWAGQLCDRGRLWPAYAWSVAGVSFSMLFYIAATKETWWLLVVGHLLFGFFGMINVCLDTASLRLAPRDDNLMHISLLRQVGSVLAAASGLFAGWWLDRFLAANQGVGLGTGCRILMVLSWAGRILAVIWLLPFLWTVDRTGETESAGEG